MRNLSRLLFAAALVAVSLLYAAPSESSCNYCYQSGNCTICYDCWGSCIYMCEPCCDGYC